MEKYYLYIILTRPNTTLSKVIRFIKNDEYTHAAISLDKELEQMYSFGRKWTYNPFIAGFKQEGVNIGIYKFSKTLPGVIMEVEISRKQYDKVKLHLDYFKLNSQFYKYNYKGLLYILFNKEKYNENRFLCSEFVYHLLKESGVVDLKISRNLVRPQDLINLKSKMIFKGNLKELKNSSYDFQMKI